MIKFKHLVMAALAIGSLTASAQSMGPIEQDPAVRTGKLDNGLTYYVMRNNYPEHRVNFYIAQRVGSLQEEESQRGLAHFLEHMAFNGTVNFPGNGVIDYTRTLGVEFGRDLNAYTSIDQTVYNINDVPSTRVEALDSCLLILKDWSNGLLLEGEEIDKERGVIHEEWRLRLSPAQRMFERNLEALYPGSKYGKRMPIGLMSVVDGFKHQELRDYYHKWYRPDNQAIIVVGDIDVDRTEAKIKELFAPIPLQANAAQVVDVEVPDNAEPIIVIDKDKEQQYSLVEVMFKHDPIPDEIKGDQMYMMMQYGNRMVSSMLNARLRERAQEPDCPFLQASAGDGNYIFSKTKDCFEITALPKPGQTEAALQAALTEAIRAAKFGFTATEYARARDEYLSQVEDTYNNRDKINNDRFGRAMASNYLEHEPITSAEYDYKFLSTYAPMLPVDLPNQLISAYVSMNDSNLVVLNFNQEIEGAVYPTAASLKGAIDAARTADIEPYVDNVKDEPLISQLPTPGRIVSEKAGDKFGYTELTLSNGVKVILKKTDYKADEVKMLAESRGGSSLYGKEDWANLELLDAVVSYSGRGNFDHNELQKAMAGKQAEADLSVTTSYERINGSSTLKDLETMFQLNYLLMTDIRKDEKATNLLLGQLETILKNQMLQPEAVFADSVNVILNNHSWRDRTFKAEYIKDVNIDRTLEIARERMANAADFTFYFIGSFDEAKIRELICQYIATLPADPSKHEKWVNVMERPTGHNVTTFKHKSETPKAIARMYWYNTALPYNLENRIAASAAGQVLEKIYLQKIREDAGAAYTTTAAGYAQRVGDKTFTTIMGATPMKPEKADEAVAIMRAEVNSVAASVDPATLKDIKELMLKDHAGNVKENEHWLNVISSYVENGIDMETDYVKTVNELTPEKVAAFVRDKILASGNSIEVVMLPAE